MTTHTIPARVYITCDMCCAELEGSQPAQDWTLLTLRTERDYYMEDTIHHTCPRCSLKLLANIAELKLLSK